MSANPTIWMPLYVGDYLGDTMHLTTEEHGAYLLLMMAYWKRGGPLPDNPKTLAAIAKMTPDAWSNAQAVLAEFFEVTPGIEWRHKRIERELAAACGKKTLAVEKARKAAGKRWGKGTQEAASNAPGNAPSNAKTMLEDCPSPSPSPSQKAEVDIPRERGASNARGARLTLSALPDDWRIFAKQERPDLDPDLTWSVFADYWKAKPGKDGLRTDWLMTWRNWVRREKAPTPTRAQGGGSVHERNRTALEAWLLRDQPPCDVIEGEFSREAAR